MQGCLFCRRSKQPVDVEITSSAPPLEVTAPAPAHHEEVTLLEQPAAQKSPGRGRAPAGTAEAPELVPFGPFYARHFRQLDPASLRNIYRSFPQRSTHAAREHAVFSVALSRQAGDILGVDLDFTDGFSARLTRVEHKGAVLEWNKRCPESLRLLQGDHIVAVNGKRGNARAIMQRLQSDESLEIEVHRPAQITIRVNAARGGLGIDTNQAKNAKSLMIANVVTGGAISAWNAANEDRVVEKYDRVVAVNGVRGTWKELSAQVRDSQELVLLIAKAPPSVQRLAEISAATVDRLVERGTTVRQLLQFYAACRRRGTVDGATTSLEVLRNVVVPETAGRPCCYMEGDFMRRLGGPTRATRIVSHRRSAAFTNLVTNIVLDATGWTSEDLAQAAFGQYSMKRVSDQPLAECCLQAEGLLRTLPSDVLDRSYWICLFAVDIHRADCGDCPRCRATEAWKRDPVAHLRASSCLSCGTAKRLPCPSAASAETPKVAFDRPDCEVNKFGAIAKRMDSVMLSLDPSLSALRSPRVVAEVSTALRLWPVHFRLAFALRQDGLDWLRGHAEELVPSLEQGEVQRPPPRQAQPAGGLASPHPAAGAGDKLVSCIAGLKFGGGMRAAELPDDARRDLEKVKHLEMDFTWLGTGLKSISDSLCDTTALDALQLESLQVVLDRCKEVHDLGTLGEALRRQAELRSLDASFRFCYKLGDSALACFAAGLPTSLTDLDLNFCFCVRVGNEGLTALAQQLPGSLRRLQLNFASCDGLTDSGVASLAKRLPPDLRSLDLTFSWIGDGGMSALAAGMPAALEELEIKCSLGNVNLTDRGLAALASRLPDGLQKINLTLAHTGASMAAQALGSSVQGLRDWRSKAQPAEPALAWPDGAAAFRLVDDDPSLDATHVVAKRAVAF